MNVCPISLSTDDACDSDFELSNSRSPDIRFSGGDSKTTFKEMERGDYMAVFARVH